jgi:hypothetical protein
MKKLIAFLFLFVAAQAVFGQFDRYFMDKTLRLDYFHCGNNLSDEYFFDELLCEPFWGGSKINLIDTLKYGDYFFEVVDLKESKVIYSRGYSTLFREWQTTAEAKNTRKSFSETVVFPYPKLNVRIDFYGRDKKGQLQKRFEYLVDVGSYFIKPERRLEFPSFDVQISGDPSNKVDIIILPDGYTNSDLGLFIKDCNDFAAHLFSFEPYAQNRDKFNIRGVLAPSLQTGSDIPADSIWVKTIVNSSFYTFDSERYCMSYDNKSIRDLAANAPYDQIYILVNSSKYGGGAIYNHYSVSVNSNKQAAKIFIHELGHGFAGLGDEYYNSEVAYSDFYSKEVEPWEPNLTTLVDFGSKWKDLLGKNVPVPTPANEFYTNQLGVFEGGGYAANDVYRPSIDCLMNTFNGDHFCKVCDRSIRQMIDFYAK